MKDTVRTTLAPGFNWPTLRDCQPPVKLRKPRVKTLAQTKPKRNQPYRRPPVLSGTLDTLPTKLVETVDYIKLLAMLEAGPVRLNYDRDTRYVTKNLRDRGYPVSRRTHRMDVEGEIVVVTTLRKVV